MSTEVNLHNVLKDIQKQLNKQYSEKIANSNDIVELAQRVDKVNSRCGNNIGQISRNSDDFDELKDKLKSLITTLEFIFREEMKF